MNRVLKLRSFHKWMKKAGVTEQSLIEAVEEILKGLIDVDLGRGLFKQRIPVPGRGKRGGARTILATNKGEKWIFLHGFQKNEKENISEIELDGLAQLALDYLKLSSKELDEAVAKGKLVEVNYEKSQT